MAKRILVLCVGTMKSTGEKDVTVYIYTDTAEQAQWVSKYLTEQSEFPLFHAISDLVKGVTVVGYSTHPQDRPIRFAEKFHSATNEFAHVHKVEMSTNYTDDPLEFAKMVLQEEELNKLNRHS